MKVFDGTMDSLEITHYLHSKYGVCVSFKAIVGDYIGEYHMIAERMYNSKHFCEQHIIDCFNGKSLKRLFIAERWRNETK